MVVTYQRAVVLMGEDPAALKLTKVLLSPHYRKQKKSFRRNLKWFLSCVWVFEVFVTWLRLEITFPKYSMQCLTFYNPFQKHIFGCAWNSMPTSRNMLLQSWTEICHGVLKLKISTQWKNRVRTKNNPGKKGTIRKFLERVEGQIFERDAQNRHVPKRSIFENRTIKCVCLFCSSTFILFARISVQVFFKNLFGLKVPIISSM